MRRIAVAALFGCLLLLLAAPHAVWSQAGSTPTVTSRPLPRLTLSVWSRHARVGNWGDPQRLRHRLYIRDRGALDRIWPVETSYVNETASRRKCMVPVATYE